MTLSPYHAKYANQSDEEIQKRTEEKKQELTRIFSQVALKTNSVPVRVAVLGCGDKRFIQAHQIIFEDVLHQPVELTTFDIVIDHLAGESNVFQHDCTLPLPHGPFDLSYGHVLLRFIETEKQWALIKNSFEALQPGGLALHILDKEDYETREPELANGLFSVPLDRWKTKLDELGITYQEILITYGMAFVILK